LGYLLFFVLIIVLWKIVRMFFPSKDKVVVNLETEKEVETPLHKRKEFDEELDKWRSE
jgi:hypothetical protein